MHLSGERTTPLALRRTEEAIQQALEEVRDSRARFRAVSREKLQSRVVPDNDALVRREDHALGPVNHFIEQIDQIKYVVCHSTIIPFLL